MKKGKTARSRTRKSARGKAASAEGVILSLRGQVMERLTAVIEQRGWTQVQAAEVLGVTQSRISDLTRGKAEKFSLDMVAILAARAGLPLRLIVGAPSAKPRGRARSKRAG